MISNRAGKISGSLTLAIDAKAKTMKAEGLDVVGFGAGEPDFDTPEYIKQAGIQAINDGFTKYTPASGTMELKKAICSKLIRENGLSYQPSQIVVSNGAKHSLYNTFQSILNPGDEVIIQQPYWLSYPELVKLADGIPVFLPTYEKDSFKLDMSNLRKAVTKKTKAVILNSPSNPTGSVYTKNELMEIAQIAVTNNLHIISDEIYEKIIYGDEKHVSIASLNEEIKELTILVNGMSKAYSMTGWRIGYTASNERIAKVMSNVQSHATSNPNSIAQYASTIALNNEDGSIKNMVCEFEKRRDYMCDRINSISGSSCSIPKGAFYVMMNISNYIGTEVKGYKINDSLSFTDALLDYSKVAVVPGIAFGDDNFVRLSYATSMENIKKGLDRIVEFIK